MFGLLTLGTLVVAVGVWATTVRITSAVIAAGTVTSAQNAVPIQHPTGGLVLDLRVTEGASVAKGDVILRLDAAEAETAHQVALVQWAEWRARLARLEAERDGAGAIVFPRELLDAAADGPAFAELVAGQRRLFEARAATLAGEILQARRRADQVVAQGRAIDLQLRALRDREDLVASDLVARRQALERGLGRRDPILALEREAVTIRERRAELRGRLSETEERRAAIEASILHLQAARRETALAELRDVRHRVTLAEETLAVRAREIETMTLRAATSGRILGRIDTGPGSVLRPAEPVGWLVPDAGRVAVELRVPPSDIGGVRPGQSVSLRFPGLMTGALRDATGVVAVVPAGLRPADTDGRRHYRVDVTLDPGTLPPDLVERILPGMPVEAFLEGETRRPLEILLAPVAIYFQRALRDTGGTGLRPAPGGTLSLPLFRAAR